MKKRLLFVADVEMPGEALEKSRNVFGAKKLIEKKVEEQQQ